MFDSDFDFANENMPAVVESADQPVNNVKVLGESMDFPQWALCAHEIGHASIVYWRRETLYGNAIVVNADGGMLYRRHGSFNITELMVKIAGPLVQCLMSGLTPKRRFAFVTNTKTHRVIQSKCVRTSDNTAMGWTAERFIFECRSRHARSFSNRIWGLQSIKPLRNCIGLAASLAKKWKQSSRGTTYQRHQR